SNVRFRIFPDDFGGELAAIAERDFDFIRIIDHMIVGQNVAVSGYYNTGAEPSLLGKMLLLSAAAAGAKLIAEKSAEERLVKRRRRIKGGIFRRRADEDIHDTRRNALDDRRKTGGELRFTVDRR